LRKSRASQAAVRPRKELSRAILRAGGGRKIASSKLRFQTELDIGLLSLRVRPGEQRKSEIDIAGQVRQRVEARAESEPLQAQLALLAGQRVEHPGLGVVGKYEQSPVVEVGLHRRAKQRRDGWCPDFNGPEYAIVA